jgi:hypothetical protein
MVSSLPLFRCVGLGAPRGWPAVNVCVYSCMHCISLSTAVFLAAAMSQTGRNRISAPQPDTVHSHPTRTHAPPPRVALQGGGAHYPYPKQVWSPAGGWWCNPRYVATLQPASHEHPASGVHEWVWMKLSGNQRYKSPRPPPSPPLHLPLSMLTAAQFGRSCGWRDVCAGTGEETQ